MASSRIKTGMGYLTAGGSTLSLGALSFCGMLVLSPSIPLACLAFFLAVAIEGAVYRQNIFNAMNRLGDQAAVLKNAIAKRELDKLIEIIESEIETGVIRNPDLHANTFLQDYRMQKKYLHELEENLTYYFGQNKKTAENEIERVKLRLRNMEELFILRIKKEKVDDADQDILASVDQLTCRPEIIKDVELENEVKTKVRLMTATIGVAGLAGFCAGFVSLSSISTCLIQIGIAATIATSIAAPFVPFVVLGYGLMMYRTVTDMIQNDTIKKWMQSAREFFKTPKAERGLKFYAKAVGVVLLLAVVVAATVATAGSWWYLAKAGVALVPKLPDIGVAIVSGIFWACSLVPTFCFNLVNSLKSIKKIPSIIRNSFSNVKKDLKETWRKENFFQFINPIRLLRKAFKASIFSGHLVSMAVTGDQVPWMPPAVSLPPSVINEAATDLHVVVATPHGDHHHHEEHHQDEKHYHDEKHHHGKKHHHGHGGINRLLCCYHHHSAHEEKTTMTKQSNSLPKHESFAGHADLRSESKTTAHHARSDHSSHAHHHHHHKHEKHEECDHHHGDAIINVVEKALGYVAAAWDCLFSFGHSTWENSKRKFFPEKQLPVLEKPLSFEVKKYELRHQLSQQEKDYRARGIVNKADEFAKLRDKVIPIRDAKEVQETEVKFAERVAEHLAQAVNDGVLTQHRRAYTSCLFAPRSKQFLQNVREDKSLGLTKGVR